MHPVYIFNINFTVYAVLSEMRTADEVTLMDAMHGANRNALCTSGAKRIIYGCEIVYNGDSAVRTRLLALHTTDTSVYTVFTCKSTLIVI